MRLIEKVWFKGHNAKYIVVPLLLPLSAIFWLISLLRRAFYKLNFKQSVRLDKPVIVVGNIGIGGNGKTPMVVYLVELCQALGLKPGVISRGYGSKAPYYPYLLNEQSTAAQAGDEPLLIYQRCNVPVVIGADRIADGNLLLAQGCNIIIADDGLQHYKLARSLELIVVDGKRLFGNGLLLPAGPLREGLWRLKPPAQIIINGECQQAKQNIFERALTMTLAAQEVCHLLSGKRMLLSDFIKVHPKINALAGIGDPERFFSTLTKSGFELNITTGYVDHHHFTATDLQGFSAELPLLMTEKDAVKCHSFATEQSWYLPVNAIFNDADNNQLLMNIKQLIQDHG